ncbi:hypothetical protein DSM26151_22180 [Agromyces marinus]|nr:hypothetical protein DSM26151_22180 [Agromyces marinus]
MPDDLDALLAAYALDAVSDDERAVVEAALAEDPALRARVRDHRAAAAALAASVEPVDPSPGLRSSVMGRLDEVEQVSAEPIARDEQVGASGERMPQAEAPAAPGPGPAERAAHAAWFRRPAPILAAVAASLVLIAGAVVGLNWFGPAGWGAQRDVQAIASASDANETTAASADGGDVTLVWSEDLARAAVRTSDLPAVGADSTYELWYIDDSGAVSAGTFDPEDGAAFVVLDGALRPGVLVGITVEPAGGSEAPTTEPIVVFET